VLHDLLKVVLNGTSDSIFIEKLYPLYMRVLGSSDVHLLENSNVRSLHLYSNIFKCFCWEMDDAFSFLVNLW